MMDSSYGRSKNREGAPPNTMEQAFAVLVLLVSSGAFMTLATTQGQVSNQGGGLIGLEIFWATTYLVTFALLIHYCPGFLPKLLKEWLLIAFAAWAVTSTIWSDDPSITFRRSIALALTVMFGFYLARRFSLKEQLNLLAWVCGICAVFSYPFGLLKLGATVDNIPGEWHGVFVQKGGLGITMALGVLVFMLLAIAYPERRWRLRLGILAVLVLLVLSRSVTAYIATAFIFALLPLTKILRKNVGKALAGIALVAIGAMLAVLWAVTHLATFTGDLGKGITMSGRLQLWALCVVMAIQKPWLGYGYSAFWLGMHGPSYRIWKALGIQMPHAHNTFIQVWLALGLVGVTLLVLAIVVSVIRAALLVRRTSQPEAIWPLMMIAFIFPFMLTGVPLPSGNTLFTMMFSMSVFASSSPVLDDAGGQTSAPKVAYRRPVIKPAIGLAGAKNSTA